jgi:tRNA threonylcarbamoyladenosine biosynthesis protein TsaB
MRLGNMILALDTSTRTVGLALYDGVQVLSEAVWTSNDYHTVELAPAIAETFQKTGLDVGALGALAVALGPGSFTGLRVGLALAKGLAIARKLPLIGVPTLDILAAAQPLSQRAEPPPLAAILRAGRGRLAVAWYQEKDDRWQPTRPVEVLTLNDLVKKIQVPTLVAGELSEEERQGLQRSAPQAVLASPAASLRRPAYLAELAWKRWKAGQVDAPAGLAPIYLHYNDPIPA